MNSNNNNQTWIFTFGSNHPHSNNYVKIKGNFSVARAIMVKTFGSRWAFQYPSEEAAGVDRFNLKEIKIN